MTATSNRSNVTVVLQCNCHGLKNKGELQQYVSSLDPQPEILPYKKQIVTLVRQDTSCMPIRQESPRRFSSKVALRRLNTSRHKKTARTRSSKFYPSQQRRNPTCLYSTCIVGHHSHNLEYEKLPMQEALVIANNSPF